jgi:hypothetical protein
MRLSCQERSLFERRPHAPAARIARLEEMPKNFRNQSEGRGWARRRDY